MIGWDFGAEAAELDDEVGCAAHSLPECLCDVEPLEGGVPISHVAMADRLLELGTPVDRFAFLSWAGELTTSLNQRRRLRAVPD